MFDSFKDLKNRADIVRNIDLIEVLKRTGAVRDKFDKAKWRTPVGNISVTGPKFMNWTQGGGSGGAIDLIIHLNNCDFKTAMFWFADNFPSHCQPPHVIKSIQDRPFILPIKNENKLHKVVHYLASRRGIPQRTTNQLISSGKLYADFRGNAVFLLLGKEKKAVGAELRGTSNLKWRGMAPGSQKGRGFFYIRNQDSTKIVLCESAIDAISFFILDPDCLALSTSGANSNPAWLPILIKRGFEIFCGFDSDKIGEALADKMISLYPTVKRLRPVKHDWNDVLRSKVRLD